ncbi:MAG: di-trans,poly-cis-decaprenylcistransferase [Proteobacteria bacterium]|jgi:undecaprenyl diphosphate synthase|nr:di-trans,poly-cis-decaprenylcistransferase [Pseudomonadota bacterium]
MFGLFKKTQHNFRPESLKHIAIIMDGNARFAKSKGLPLQLGHKMGVENIEKIVDYSLQIGLPYLSLYAFSWENWQRPKEEVDYLMELLENYLDNQLKKLLDKQIKLLVSGSLHKLSQNLQQKIALAVEKSQNNTALVLNIAFSYSGRQEILDAVVKIQQDLVSQKLNLSQLNQEVFANYLYQPQIPCPDLLIRTAGDLRISNFFLWQIAYTELYFVNKFWPSFSASDLAKAINNFNQRVRKYGTRK